METLRCNSRLARDFRTFRVPYSVGKLIEWKRVEAGAEAITVTIPYSVGKLIEWKLTLVYLCGC